MQYTRTSLIALFLLTFSWTIVLGQEVDKDLLVGKWKFAKVTTGHDQQDFKYNGDPLLVFEKDGSWITEDTNPNYRQRGSWKVENNILIREAVVSGMSIKTPFTIIRIIEKLTATELIYYVATNEGVRTFTFYFARTE
jgi:hypothetical protein